MTNIEKLAREIANMRNPEKVLAGLAAFLQGDEEDDKHESL